jgi:hypothetical protein
MMNDSEIDGEFRDGSWAECACTATYYNNLIINKDKKSLLLSKCLKTELKDLGILKDLVTTKNEIQGKLSNKGIVCVLLGYVVNHADEVYRQLNPRTKSIIKSRDVVCLNKSYGAWIKSKNDTNISDDSDSETDTLKNKIEAENLLMTLQMTGRTKES